MAKRAKAETTERPAPNPAIKRCIDAYHQAFLQRFGFKPQIHGGKDASHFKQLLATWGEPVVMELIEDFLSTTDPRVLRSDYTVGALYNLAQHLRLRREGHRIDERTAHNLDAAARAAGRR